MVYLVDINIFSHNIDEHLENVETVFTLLRNAGLTIKLNKYVFMHDSIEFGTHRTTKQITSRAKDYRSRQKDSATDDDDLGTILYCVM